MIAAHRRCWTNKCFHPRYRYNSATRTNTCDTNWKHDTQHCKTELHILSEWEKNKWAPCFHLTSVAERVWACWCAAGSFSVALKPLDALERHPACVTWHHSAHPPGCKNRQQCWSPGTYFTVSAKAVWTTTATRPFSLSPTLLPFYLDCRARQKLLKLKMAHARASQSADLSFIWTQPSDL